MIPAMIERVLDFFHAAVLQVLVLCSLLSKRPVRGSNDFQLFANYSCVLCVPYIIVAL